MKTGWMWIDNRSFVDVVEKIREAAKRYREKFGRWPTVCFAHPTTIASAATGTVKLDGESTVRVAPARSILPHHFWFGIEEA